jgi:hypothetical protein
MKLSRKENPFQPIGDEKEHFWLARRMAKATGTDLVGAMEDHALSQDDWAEMVRRCRGCEWTCGCKRWLDDMAPDGRDVPTTCVNHVRFEKLRKTYKAEDQ